MNKNKRQELMNLVFFLGFLTGVGYLGMRFVDWRAGHVVRAMVRESARK